GIRTVPEHIFAKKMGTECVRNARAAIALEFIVSIGERA
ncbi:MAG: hypothetical protein QG663_1373, partial [Thermodesulfobacteriota bacterium]|nr:hypothetical protein [Thermodesulfobacteriota bacterium]